MSINTVNCLCIQQAIFERDRIKTDLSALFMPRQPAMTADEAVRVLSIYYLLTVVHRLPVG